jgi:uncharacterized protein
MKSKVFAIDMRASDKENLLQKLARLLKTLELNRGIKPRDLTAIKLHFGERGNTSFIRPIFVRQVVDEVRAAGGLPFITDANTLYVGTRTNSAQHLQTAIENGFAFAVVNAPLTITDGLKGSSFTEVPINMNHVQTAYVGSDVVDADVLISLAHFKLHEVAGIGGAIKNVGMGCAARRGKMAQHADISPKVKAKICIACGTCLDNCAQQAISYKDHNGEAKAFIDPKKCVGCAECIAVCPEGAIMVQWSKSIPLLMKKMVEYTAATVKGKDGKCFYLNFVTQVSPACDCHPHADAPLVRDIGILASTDPVAIDKASADLINQEPGLPGNCLAKTPGPGEDKIKAVYPHIDWMIQLDYAREIGLGSTDYELIWLDNRL